MTVNDDIRDLELRHHVGIQRLSTDVVRKIIRLLNDSDKRIVEELERRSGTLEGTFTSKRLQQLLKAIREINHDAHVKIGRELREELQNIARYEAAFQQRLLKGSVPVQLDLVTPSSQMLRAAVTSRPFQGRLLREYVRDMEAASYRRLSDTIRAGVIEGQTSDQIIRAIRGTQAQNFADGVLEISRTGAERIVRTATNHIANASRQMFYEENDDLVKGWQYVATLDTRTCLECAELDGQVFDIGEGPQPPRHLSCRCSSTPVVKSWRELGIDLDEAPEGTRASMDGQVSATETYQTWLRGQPASVQDDALGPTRGRLFREGGLSVDRFVDVRGNQLNLDQLRRREADAFDQAGM